MSLALTGFQILLNAIPESVHAKLTSRISNHLLRGQDFSRRLESLEGRRIWLSITDTDTCLRFRYENGKLLDDRSNQPADIHFRGDIRSFIQLATRQEDPDTLFFARKLSIEGNTEDGLVLKNFMDSMEFDSEAHLKAWLGTFMASRLMPILQRVQPARYVQKLIKTMD